MTELTQQVDKGHKFPKNFLGGAYPQTPLDAVYLTHCVTYDRLFPPSNKKSCMKVIISYHCTWLSFNNDIVIRCGRQRWLSPCNFFLLRLSQLMRSIIVKECCRFFLQVASPWPSCDNSTSDWRSRCSPAPGWGMPTTPKHWRSCWRRSLARSSECVTWIIPSKLTLLPYFISTSPPFDLRPIRWSELGHMTMGWIVQSNTNQFS